MSRVRRLLAALPFGFVRRPILVWAVDHDEQDLIDRLLPGLAHVEMETWTGFPLEYLAAHRGNLEVLRTLLARRSDLNVHSDYLGRTLLHFAVSSENVECARFLLEQGADLMAENRGITPLHDAASSSLEMCQFLLDAGAELDLGKGEAGTPLSEAGWHPEITEYLLSLGADPEATDAAGRTPLMKSPLAATTKLLLDADADVHRVDHEGRDALSHAAKQNAEAIPLLVEAGGDIHRRDASGSTPLAQAMCGHSQEYPEAVKALLANGADVEQILMEPDYTPLAIACLHGQLPVIPIVIEAGADLHARSPSGKTVLRRVRDDRRQAPGYFKSKLKKVEKILIDAGASE